MFFVATSESEQWRDSPNESGIELSRFFTIVVLGTVENAT